MKKYIKTFNHKDYLVIEIILDELNLSECPKLESRIVKALKQFDYPDVIFDLKNFNRIDSIGIGFFIAIRNIFKEHNSEMVIVSSSERVLKVLEAVSMERFCKMFNSMEDAVKHLVNDEGVSSE